MKRILLPVAAALMGVTGLAYAMGDPPEEESSFRDRAPSDEVVYFVLPDRFENGDPSNDTGGIEGDRLTHGFDPTHKGFYHGGDLKGLTEKLDYIEGMGVTAIWFAPIFKNKPVQGPEGDESAGYHGYWVTDFTSIDPHFGTNEEFKAFVDAAHARGMKVYMDIITNHTADVIQYEEGNAFDYSYRSLADYPYSRQVTTSAAINEGFLGDDVLTEENFAKLTSPEYAYTPVVPDAEKDVKVPAWLNNPIFYHNRGSTTFSGESSRYGDFAGLDDLYTEHPRVVDGMIEIYRSWITRFGIDGFRIDTAKHVNPEFWQKFVPAMLETAEAEGIPNFHVFGEVYSESPDSGFLARFTRRDGFPAVLDFAFQTAVRDVVAGDKPPSVLVDMFAGDVNYEGGEKAALAMPTFLGNHDMGRFSTLVKSANPDISQDELLARTKLAHAMLMTLRGSPVIYSGDEQGFVGDGHDQAAREDMFPSRTDSYNDNDLIGTDATTADANFDTAHPLYSLIRELAAVRAKHAALRSGKQVARSYNDIAPGLVSFSRFDPETGAEYLLAFNTSSDRLNASSVIGYGARSVEALHGSCPQTVRAPGSVALELPPFGWCIARLSETAQ
ncbi:alpha-amylase family glycosyl hydrolase [Erythrobacter sp. THAF29]|uniref:alpha-amylase family glycosyl hydrolase n=1 Tax=Erythrobacter sp. THAF29 TaxID=2587851 RepID=UPI0012A809B2|nr:alpha-amylase family glycosyl hydrolase [Erythrobacter sp. THAF29]QFT77335.1 Alpha-amylase precursor [Erythrobacter sp. THAF29]